MHRIGANFFLCFKMLKLGLSVTQIMLKWLQMSDLNMSTWQVSWTMSVDVGLVWIKTYQNCTQYPFLGRQKEALAFDRSVAKSLASPTKRFSCCISASSSFHLIDKLSWTFVFYIL